MARSPLTLAASVTSALPRVGVVGVGALTEGATGRYDSALADLDDGRRVVVRAPADPDAASELAAQTRALRALTPGVRGLLPFRAPELLGETTIGDTRTVVVDFLPGYRVDAAHLPPGRGAATSAGQALAALHALPLSVVRGEGLPARTPQQVRQDATRLIDRAAASHSVPESLLERWRRAVDADELWQFESAVVLGGAGAASFLFEDVDGVPRVTGVLDWHGLSIGDPATDLQWLASAPEAADDVYTAYVAHSRRAPDGLARSRGRLYAELEFARWLLHGIELGRDDIVEDATELLKQLDAGARSDEIVTDAALGVDDALALLDRMPEPAPAAGDTSMHTDAFDPAELSLWLPAEDRDEESAGTTPDIAVDFDPSDIDSASTAPLDLSALRLAADPADPAPTNAKPNDTAPNSTTPADAAPTDGAPVDGTPDDTAPHPLHVDDEAEAARASEAALRRWTAG